MDAEEKALAELRKKIDTIDHEIHDLINKRAGINLKVAAVKIKYQGEKAQLYRPEREQSILEQVKAHNKGPLSDAAIVRIFTHIITECRDFQIASSGSKD